MEGNSVLWNHQTNAPIWFDKAKFFVWITAMGLDYLEQWNTNELNKELIISNKSVNTASVTNMKVQRQLTIVTIFVAIIAAGFSIANYFKPEPKMAELNKNIRLISTKLEALKPRVDSPKYLPTFQKAKSGKK